MAKKAQMWALYLLLAGLFVVGGLVAWNYDWSKSKPNFDGSNPGVDKVTPQEKCPKTSAERGQPCCRQLESGEMQAAVGVLYVPESCKKCPDDTHFLDNAPEAGYMLCECNACPN